MNSATLFGTIATGDDPDPGGPILHRRRSSYTELLRHLYLCAAWLCIAGIAAMAIVALAT